MWCDAIRVCEAELNLAVEFERSLKIDQAAIRVKKLSL